MRKLIFVLYLLALGACVTAGRAKAEPKEEPKEELKLVAVKDASREEPLRQIAQPMTKFDRDPEADYTVQLVHEEIPEPELEYFGKCRLTWYCSCQHCTGPWYGLNSTASGVPPTAGWTVANGSLPFGTRVLIDGHEYEVQDRGVGGDQFDIYTTGHDQIPPEGVRYTDVYILEWP